MTTTDTTTRAPLWQRGRLVAVGLAGLWVVLAILRPATTFHLAPLIVAGAPSVLTDTRPARSFALEQGLLGLAISGWATLALLWFGALDGPALRPFTSAIQETIVLALAGAVGGAVWSARRR